MTSDDPAVGDAEILLRRIATYGDTNMMIVDDVTGEARISSGAFRLDHDGCSVYRSAVLDARGLSATAVVRAPQNAVVSVTAAAVRSVSLGVRPDPNPPEGDGHPRDEAHALIVNPSPLGKNPLRRALRELAATARFVVTP
jgi:hypothetical protein